MANQGPSLTERVSIFMGAIFLFGLAYLFMADFIWPGIMFLIWLTAIPILLVEHRWLGVWVILQMTLWMVGLPLLLMSDAVFPGILMLAGFSTLLTAIVHPSKLDEMNKRRRMGEKTKRKRTMPLPYEDERPNHHDDYATDEWQPGMSYELEPDERRLHSRRQ